MAGRIGFTGALEQAPAARIDPSTAIDLNLPCLMSGGRII
jgi:hypothetical protein